MRKLAQKTIRVLSVFAGLANAWPAAAEDAWTGIYLGGTLGRRFVDAEWETTCLQFGRGQCPDSGGTFATQLATNNPAEFHDKSTRFGAYVGAQLQLQNIVIGIEGDAAKANNQLKTEGIPGAELAGAGDRGPDNADIRAEWDGSVRGRFGFLLTPQLLIYATGGVSWMKVKTSIYCGAEFPSGWCSLENVGKTSRDSETVRGTTWGGGVEGMIDSHWLLRAEFRRTNFDDMDSLYFDGVLGNADALTATVDTETDTISIGLAYKF